MHVLGLGVVIELEADLIAVESAIDRSMSLTGRMTTSRVQSMRGPRCALGGYTLFNAGEASVSSVSSSSIVTSMNGEGDHRLDVLVGPGVGDDPLGELAALGRIGDHAAGGRVSVDGSLQVEREVRVGLEVVDPAALRRASPR